MTDPNQFLCDAFYTRHCSLLLKSYQYLTGKVLLENNLQPSERVAKIFGAPFALVSHGIGDDPLFNFANRTALELFELSWAQLIELPSKKSVEPENRQSRKKLLKQVAETGFIDDYCGIRISSTGKRFYIEDATVWNLIDHHGAYHGQAAVFHRWKYL